MSSYRNSEGSTASVHFDPRYTPSRSTGSDHGNDSSREEHDSCRSGRYSPRQYTPGTKIRYSTNFHMNAGAVSTHRFNRDQRSQHYSSFQERSKSRSPSPSQRRRRPSMLLGTHDDEKPWFKKKTLWTTVASVATVMALVPATLSAYAAQDAAVASHRSARASRRSANAVEKSANAVVNTSIAQGHMDHTGRYTGPPKHHGGASAHPRLPSHEFDDPIGSQGGSMSGRLQEEPPHRLQPPREVKRLQDSARAYR